MDDELAAHVAAGGRLSVTGNASTGELRQLVSVEPGRGGSVRVHVETYHPTEWDTEVENFDEHFASLDEALAWLERERGVSRTQLQRRPKV